MSKEFPQVLIDRFVEAGASGDVDKVLAYLKAGMDVNSKNCYGNNLCRAALNDHPHVMML